MHDPRYWQQWNRTHFVKALSVGDVGFTNSSLFASAGTSHADWSQNLGSGANAGPGVFPAKYSFQATSATCAGGVGVKPDYVVFSTGLGSGAASLPLKTASGDLVQIRIMPDNSAQPTGAIA
jgi:hypothetical protein